MNGGFRSLRNLENESLLIFERGGLFWLHGLLQLLVVGKIWEEKNCWAYTNTIYLLINISVTVLTMTCSAETA